VRPDLDLKDFKYNPEHSGMKEEDEVDTASSNELIKDSDSEIFNAMKQ